MRGSNFGLEWENCGHFWEELANDRVFMQRLVGILK